MNRKLAITRDHMLIDREIALLHAAPRSRELSLTTRDSVLLAAFAALLIFGILAFGSVDEWATCVLEIGSALLLLLYIWPQISSAQIQMIPHGLYLPMALFGLIILIQVLLRISGYVYATRYELLKYVAYGNLFAVANCYGHVATRRLLTTFATAGFVISLFAIVQDLTYNGKIYWLRPSVFHAFGPYFNSNHYAGLMEMFTPIALAIALTDRRRSRKLFWMIAGIVMASTILVCASRGGMIAVAIQMTVLATYFVSRKNPGRAWVLFVIGLLIASLASWLDNGRLLQQLNTLRDPLNNSDVTSRLAIARDSLRMVRDRPILGWGLGLFRTIYPRYRSFSTDLVINQTHNDYVQVLVETGILGFACVVWFIVNLYRIGISQLKLHSQDAKLRALGALVGCTGILVHSFSDFNLQIPANAALFYVLCGIAGGGNVGKISKTCVNRTAVVRAGHWHSSRVLTRD